MPAPSISFYTSSDVTSHNAAFVTGSWGLMASVYDFGTIDTGSSGSTTFFWIVNNASGSTLVADALLSSSAQAQGDTTCLGLGHHEPNAADHASESSTYNGLQSGSLTGSIFVSSSFFYMSNNGYSGSVKTSGSLSMPYINIVSGSAATGRRLFMPGAFYILSGSPAAGATSGSGWLVASYINVLNTTPQGVRSGSFCLRYKYT